MIRTEKEYRASLSKLKQNEQAIEKQLEQLKNLGLSKDKIDLAMSPILNFYNQLKLEVEAYERIKARDWDFIYQLADLQHVGKLFTALRIAYGLTQRELAALLGVSEAQVSKDERNEYHGISLQRAMRIMSALDVSSPHLEFRRDLDRNRLMEG